MGIRKMGETAAIEIKNLVKSFAGERALNDLTFSVNKGELFGLIGPDGAGKTTLMRIICGLLLPQSGRVSCFNMDTIEQSRTIKNMIGYMPQRFSLYPDLSVKENINFFADLFNVSKSDKMMRFQRLIKFSRLEPFINRRAANLSGGMKQKLALSCTLIHAPEILILDEPTTGVDPVSRQEFWQILLELKKEGVTILVSTPYMDEAGLCDHVGFMYKGKLLTLDKPQKLPEQYPYRLMEVKCKDTIRMADHFNSLEAVRDAQIFGDRLHVVVSETERLFNEIQVLKKNGQIEYATEIKPGLEDVFVYMMERDND
jgi:ABC-2 type transport system ATP-binding protein